jgi:hypothetical protein
VDDIRKTTGATLVPELGSVTYLTGWFSAEPTFEAKHRPSDPRFNRFPAANRGHCRQQSQDGRFQRDLSSRLGRGKTEQSECANTRGTIAGGSTINYRSWDQDMGRARSPHGAPAAAALREV